MNKQAEERVGTRDCWGHDPPATQTPPTGTLTSAVQQGERLRKRCCVKHVNVRLNNNRVFMT